MAKRHAIRRRFRRPTFRRFHRKSKRVPILPTLAVVIPAAQMIQNAGGLQGFITTATQDPMWVGKQLAYNYIGYDVDAHAFDGNKVIQNVLMYGGLMGGHMIANKFGVNRQIGKIPFVGKYIEL